MRSTVANIDLDALLWNYRTIRQQTGNAMILGMVKANAYGHGMIEVSKALQNMGIDMLGVAFVSEGIELRRSGISVPILVLTPPEEREATDVVSNELQTVACDIIQTRALGTAARQLGVVANIHVYVDTGMHRDGIRCEHVDEFVREVDQIQGVAATGICTHFATSDEPHNPFMKEQRLLFESVLQKLASRGRHFDVVHIANTGAIWNDVHSHCTMVRPGLSLYGYSAETDDVLTLRPVMSITSRVVSVRRVRSGETVSYGRRWMASHDTMIATIPIGYGDGYSRRMTGKAHCLIGGKHRPIIGTICMDECMVDIGDQEVNIGDEVVLLGSQADETGRLTSIDANDIAVWAQTIPYEVTTSILSRVPRRYVGSNDRSSHV